MGVTKKAEWGCSHYMQSLFLASAGLYCLDGLDENRMMLDDQWVGMEKFLCSLETTEGNSLS